MLNRTLTRLGLGLLLSAEALAAGQAASLQPTQIAPSGLNQEQAQQVLRLALKHQRHDLNRPGVFIDGDLRDDQGRPPHPGYFDFSLGYNDPKAGATEYWGLYAVSVLTGDVWEINRCERLVFVELKHLQGQIMARTGKTQADEEAQRQGLGCEDED